MGEYVPVARVADFEEAEIRAYEVDDQIVAIAQVGDQYFAFDDTCTHEHCSLADGDLDGTTIICPCHDGEFDITTGQVLEGPPEEPVNTYPAQVIDDEIQIEII